jgi:hypothetical protein
MAARDPETSLSDGSGSTGSSSISPWGCDASWVQPSILTREHISGLQPLSCSCSGSLTWADGSLIIFVPQRHVHGIWGTCPVTRVGILFWTFQNFHMIRQYVSLFYVYRYLYYWLTLQKAHECPQCWLINVIVYLVIHQKYWRTTPLMQLSAFFPQNRTRSRRYMQDEIGSRPFSRHQQDFRRLHLGKCHENSKLFK